MSIVTISRGCYSRGQEVAEKVAERMSYKCISRDMLLETSKEFNIPEIKLYKAMNDAPTFFERIGSRKELYITFIQYALLREFVKDNVVYHGLAGHIFAKGLKNSLKVRINSDWQDRVQLEMQREGISREKAMKLLKKEDLERKRWSQGLYGIDPNQPEHYDLVIHIKHLSPTDAADIICHTLSLDCFKTTPESQKELEDRVDMYRRFVGNIK